MPHCGEHISEGKSDSNCYRLSGRRRTDSATVAMETSDAATASTRRDNRRTSSAPVAVETTNAATARRATAKATSPQRRQPVAQDDEGRLQRDDGKRRRSGTSWSHDDDDAVVSVPTGNEEHVLRRRTMVAARRRTDDRQLGAERPRRRTVLHCGMPSYIRSITT